MSAADVVFPRRKALVINETSRVALTEAAEASIAKTMLRVLRASDSERRAIQNALDACLADFMRRATGIDA